MTYHRIIYRRHAVLRMAERSIDPDDIRLVLEQGEVIADYPDDKPYASCLILGWIRGRPLHIVAADNHQDEETIVITAYEPDTSLWTDDYRSKRT